MCPPARFEAQPGRQLAVHMGLVGLRIVRLIVWTVSLGSTRRNSGLSCPALAEFNRFLIGDRRRIATRVLIRHHHAPGCE